MGKPEDDLKTVEKRHREAMKALNKTTDPAKRDELEALLDLYHTQLLELRKQVANRKKR